MHGLYGFFGLTAGGYKICLICEALYFIDRIGVLSGTMNDRHRQAKRAQRECSDLYLLLLLHRYGQSSGDLVCLFHYRVSSG